jgi:beta-aspartyl-peptidase (threonine type)
VGARAVDRDGDLAAGTSTGGLTNKPVGRIGDSPIIGAGTYARNETAAVSATGTGEFFIRQAVAHEISAAMEYGKLAIDRAARRGIAKVEELGGDGGVIALDRRGNLAMPFNTEGMYRGYVTRDGEVVTKIYGDE